MCFFIAGIDGSPNSQFESLEWYRFFFLTFTNKMLIKIGNSRNLS